MARRNRNDKLTRNPKKSPYWLINFRIPTDLSDHPLFIGRNLNTPFQKSTGETDHDAAARVRDQFFREHDIFQRKKSPDELYSEVFSGESELSETDIQVIEEELAAELAFEGTISNKRFQAMLQAQQNLEALATNPSTPVTSEFSITLSKACELYRKHRSDLPHKTLLKIDTALKRLSTFLDTDPKVDSIKSQQVFRHINQLRESGSLSASTVSNDLSFLGQVFTYTQNLGYTNEQLKNPFVGHTLKNWGSTNQRRQIPLSHAKGLLSLANDHDCKILISLGHYAGVRIDEAFNIKICHDPEKGVFLDVASDYVGKTLAATRQIPAHDDLIKTLVDTEEMPGLGACHKIQWQVKTTSGLGKRFKKLATQYFADKPPEESTGLVFHSFRHSFATALANHFDELMAATLTGHKLRNKASTELGRTYFHGSEWKKKQEMIAILPSLIS